MFYFSGTKSLVLCQVHTFPYRKWPSFISKWTKSKIPHNFQCFEKRSKFVTLCLWIAHFGVWICNWAYRTGPGRALHNALPCLNFSVDFSVWVRFSTFLLKNASYVAYFQVILNGGSLPTSLSKRSLKNASMHFLVEKRGKIIKNFLTWLAIMSGENTSRKEAVEFMTSPLTVWYRTAEAIGLKPYFDPVMDKFDSSRCRDTIGDFSSISSIRDSNCRSLFLP